MKDIFGQEFKVGNNVVWIAGKQQYAGAKVYKVLKVTEKRIQIDTGKTWTDRGTYVDPTDLVIVDKLM